MSRLKGLRISVVFQPIHPTILHRRVESANGDKIVMHKWIMPSLRRLSWHGTKGEARYAMFKRKDLSASLDGLEIGATGPSRLQFVVNADGRRVAVHLAADEARWLASALIHWADDSDTISPVRIVP